MAHDVVPTEYAVMPPTAPHLVMLVRSPTMTSGPALGGGGGSVYDRLIVNAPVPPLNPEIRT